MSKEFTWDDKSIEEMLVKAFSERLFVGSYKTPKTIIEEFKASHSTEDRKPEWEIVSFLGYGSEYKLMDWRNFRCYTQPTFEAPGQQISQDWALQQDWLSIKSVRRLSDNEIFTVGDMIEWGFGGLKDGVIEKFEVDYFDLTQIRAYNSFRGLGFKRWKKTPQRTKLFTVQLTQEQINKLLKLLE